MTEGARQRRMRVLVSVFIAMAVMPATALADDLVKPLFNNVGIAQDPGSNANFDTVGYSLYAPALTLAGVSGGSAVNADGLHFTWPNEASGKPDNMVVDG